MAETQTQAEAGEVVRAPTARAVAIHLHLHVPPPCCTQAKSVPKSESPRRSEESSSSSSSSCPRPSPSKPRPQPKLKSEPRPCLVFPHNVPVRSSATTIHRIPVPLRTFFEISPRLATPIAVAIGPYHHGSPYLQEMEEAKQVARDEFCRVAAQPPEAIEGKIASLAADARACYEGDFRNGRVYENDMSRFVEIMFMDGCFLLQFMACMCPGNRDGAPAPDGLWAKVHARIDAIARDVMLLENQIPWIVLQALMGCTPGVSWPVNRFLHLMASAFDVGNDAAATPTQQHHGLYIIDLPPPPHLLGLFHRRQVGAARTQSLHVPSLSSLSGTAVEVAEMGVKLTAGKARIFGDMTMTKRRPRLGLYGELALAPIVLNELTVCWLFNMVAHEACLGATCADNFAVSSYVSVVSLLMNQQEDVKELRGKGVVVSTFSDEMTLSTFKNLAAHLRVGYRYYDVFERLQEYRQERWVWIAVHGFLYRNLKTIIAVFSAIGVLAGLFKSILSLKHPQQG